MDRLNWSVAGIEVVLCLALVALAVPAHEAGPLRGDLAFVEAVQSLPRWLEPLARGVRAATGTQVVLAFGTMLAPACWWSGKWREALMVTLLLVTLAVVQPGLKEVVDRPRPDPAIVDRQGEFSSTSFPSGHVLSGLVFYCSLALVLSGGRKRLLRTVPPATFVAASAFGLFANSYLGVHWPTDAAGSALTAAILLLPAWAWQYRRLR